jgi:hypothetical protein
MSPHWSVEDEPAVPDMELAPPPEPPPLAPILRVAELFEALFNFRAPDIE